MSKSAKVTLTGPGRDLGAEQLQVSEVTAFLSLRPFIQGKNEDHKWMTVDMVVGGET